MRQLRSSRLGRRVDGRFTPASRRAGRGSALPPDCLFAVAACVCCAIVVSIAGALMLVLGACPTDRPFTWSESVQQSLQLYHRSPTRTARLLAPAGQTCRVDAPSLRVRPVMVRDEADGLRLGRRRRSSSRRRGSLIHYRACMEGYTAVRSCVGSSGGAAVRSNTAVNSQ